MLQSILIPIALFAMVTLIVWFENVTKRQERQRRADLVRALIDRYSSAGELTEALSGAEGRALARALLLDGGERKPKWLGLIVPGTILLSLGLGFLLLAGPAAQSRVFVIPGVICAAIGVALLVSGYVAWRTQQVPRADAARSDPDPEGTPRLDANRSGGGNNR